MKGRAQGQGIAYVSWQVYSLTLLCLLQAEAMAALEGEKRALGESLAAAQAELEADRQRHTELCAEQVCASPCSPCPFATANFNWNSLCFCSVSKGMKICAGLPHAKSGQRWSK